MTLHHANGPQGHLLFVKHFPSEVRTELFVAGKGVVSKWGRVRKQDHWLDALYDACAVGHGCRVKLVEETAPPPPPERPPVDWSDPRQNPLLIKRRW